MKFAILFFWAMIKLIIFTNPQGGSRMKKYLVVAMFAVLSTVATAADKGTGIAVEAYSGGQVGIAKYEANWAAGLSTQMTGSNINSNKSSSSQGDNASSDLNVWGEWRKDLGGAAQFILGAQVGFGFNGKSSGYDRTGDTYLGVFTGVESSVTERILVKGFVSLGNRSFDTSFAKANNVTALQAAVGVSYFL